MKVIKVKDPIKLNILNELLQTYEAEFSPITKKKQNKQGQYELDVDLSQTENFLLYINDKVIGFCVKGYSEDRHDIYEFYIIPTERNNKVGRKFAKDIFSKYKGPWQVRQIEGADKAISFWRKAIGEYTNNKFEEAIIEDKYWGKVTRQIFMS